MNTAWHKNEERLLELLADRALFGLDDAERNELQELLSLMPEFDAESMDQTTAAVQLAYGEIDPEPLPAWLRSSVKEKAVRHWN